MVSKIIALSEKFFQQTVQLRRQIHKNPELGFEEYETAELIATTLKNLGWQVREGVAKTGVVGLLKGTKPGPTIALRADMDALPIDEQTDLSFASEHPGKMHACGHDAHVAILLGTALVLTELRQELKGSVKLIFQPAEEGPGGAIPMIEAGVLKNPEVDLIFGFHVWHDVPVGQIAAQSGAVMAAPDNFTITLKGKGGHGAQPHLCIDAIAAAAQVINSLQHIVSRRVNPLDPVVLTIGKINGGVRGNVIAEDLVMEGTLRTLSEETRRQCKLWIEEQVERVCQPLGVRAQVEFLVAYDILISDQEATNWLIDSAEKVLGPENVIKALEPSMGGEDFSFFLNSVQGAHFRLGIKGSKEQFPIHHNRFDIDEEALKTGIQVLSQVVWDNLERRSDHE